MNQLSDHRPISLPFKSTSITIITVNQPMVVVVVVVGDVVGDVVGNTRDPCRCNSFN